MRARLVAHYFISFNIIIIITVIIIAQNAYCSGDIYLQLMKYLRSVILPIIIQINARRRVSLVEINARFFPVGNMTLLINLKKAEHRNNELFVICFRYCLAYSHL